MLISVHNPIKVWSCNLKKKPNSYWTFDVCFIIQFLLCPWISFLIFWLLLYILQFFWLFYSLLSEVEFYYHCQNHVHYYQQFNVYFFQFFLFFITYVYGIDDNYWTHFVHINQPRVLLLEFIQTSTLEYSHPPLSSPEEEIAAMKAAKAIVAKHFPLVDATGDKTGTAGAIRRARAFSPGYAGWETNDIIVAELKRNIALAMVCVFLMTLLLIASLRTSVFVTACVFMTVVSTVLASKMSVWLLFHNISQF